MLSITGDSAAITVTFSAPVDQVAIFNPLNLENGGELDVISGIASSASGVVDSFTSGSGSPVLNGPGIVSVAFDDVPGGEGDVLDLPSFRVGGAPVPAAAALGLAALRQCREPGCGEAMRCVAPPQPRRRPERDRAPVRSRRGGEACGACCLRRVSLRRTPHPPR
jgi:hypothetical protein